KSGQVVCCRGQKVYSIQRGIGTPAGGSPPTERADAGWRGVGPVGAGWATGFPGADSRPRVRTRQARLIAVPVCNLELRSNLRPAEQVGRTGEGTRPRPGRWTPREVRDPAPLRSGRWTPRCRPARPRAPSCPAQQRPPWVPAASGRYRVNITTPTSRKTA